MDDADPELEDPGTDPSDPEKSFQAKVFNLNNKGKAQELKRQLWLRKRLENRLMRQCETVFAMEGHRVATAVNGLEPESAKVAAHRAITSNIPQWKTVLISNLTVIAKLFGKRVFDSLKNDPQWIQRKDGHSMSGFGICLRSDQGALAKRGGGVRGINGWQQNCYCPKVVSFQREKI